MQVSVFSLEVNPQVHDAPADEHLPRDAVRLTSTLVRVENQPAFGVIDQYGVIDELVELAVIYFWLQSIPRPRFNL